MIKKYSFLIFSYAIVVFASFFLGGSCLALTTWVSNDFSAETLGNIPSNDKNKYFSYAVGDVAAAYVNSGCLTNQCLLLAGNATKKSANKWTSDELGITGQYAEFNFKITAYPNATESFEIDFDGYNGVGRQNYINFDILSDGDFYINGSKLIENIALNQYYRVTFTWDKDNVFVRLDGDAYLAYALTTSYNASWPLTSLYITASAGNTASLYIDDIVFGLANFDEWTSGMYELSDTEVDFFVPYQDLCFYGYDCRITLHYNQMAIGSVANFIWDNGQPLFPEYATYSYTLQNVQPYEQTFLILASTTPTSATTTPYAIFLETSAGDIMKAGMQIVWVDRATYELDYNEESVCDDVASSTGSFADDMRYGWECGTRKVIAWMFVASPDSYENLNESLDKLLASFPFSYFNETIRTFQEVDDYRSASSTTISMNAVLPTEYQSSSSPSIYSSDMFSSGLGIIWDNYFYPMLNYAIYFFTFLYFVNRFLSMSQKTNE